MIEDNDQKKNIFKALIEFDLYDTKNSIVEKNTMISRKNKFDYDELISCAKGELFGTGNLNFQCPYAND